MNFTTEILRYLKAKYEDGTGKTMISDKTMVSSQAEFYFEDLNDNLIEPMSRRTLASYSDGSGNELEEKMRSIRSSSAMTYNLLGNGPAKIIKDDYFIPGTYTVEFEAQLPTIKNNPHKANLDAFLCGENELIFCEMKMTEWLFNKPCELRESYLDSHLYYDLESYPSFRACIDKIVADNPSDYRTYQSKLLQYDGFQMFKHTLSIYNYVFANKNVQNRKILLVNCVWHLPETTELSAKALERYKEAAIREETEFNLFYNATKPIRERFAEIGVDFDIKFINAADFCKQFQKTPEQIKYLNRYF